MVYRPKGYGLMPAALEKGLYLVLIALVAVALLLVGRPTPRTTRLVVSKALVDTIEGDQARQVRAVLEDGTGAECEVPHARYIDYRVGEWVTCRWRKQR